LGLAETQSLQIQTSNIGLDHPYQMILRYQLLQCGRKQAALLTTFALDVAHKRQCPHRLMEALSSACSRTARFSHSLKCGASREAALISLPSATAGSFPGRPCQSGQAGF